MRQRVLLKIRLAESARLRKGLLKKELAKAAGLCDATVSRAFSTGEIGLVALRKIASVLNLPVSDLLAEEEPTTHAA